MEDDALNTLSKLERYFLRPEGEEFDNLTYLQYFENYMITATRPSASLTQNTTVYEDLAGTTNPHYVYKRQWRHVARMDMKRPGAGEVYFLRILLDHYLARSYADLKTVDEVLYGSFAHAAVALGLAETDGEGQQCIEEAIKNLRSPGELRSLFVLLINEGSPAADLLDKNIESLSLDFEVNGGLTQNLATNEALADIAKKLDSLGKTNSDFGLPEPLNKSSELNRMNNQYDKTSCTKSYNEKFATLNGEKQEFVKTVLVKIQNDTGGLIFLNGPAGRGKTYVCNALLDYVRGFGQVALACASSAIAAMNYPGGRTAHNIFKIPVKEDYLDISEIQCDVLMNGERAELLRHCKLIIWDEFSMMHRQNFEAVLSMLQKIRRNNSISARLTPICLGDFRQIPPVIQYGTAKDTINASILSSPTWHFFEQFD